MHGNYLKASIRAAGLDPDNLPESDPSKMSFGGGEGSKPKAWKEIWGCGQGIGAVDKVVPVAEMVARLKREYDEARARLLPRGAGSVFSFDLKGNREQGKKFIETLKVFSHLANVGDCRSLVIHPASTTHFRMSDEALVNAGIRQGTIRLSIGLEDPDDLIDDLKRALKAAEKAGG